jgi:hypothetical protein
VTNDDDCGEFVKSKKETEEDVPSSTPTVLTAKSRTERRLSSSGKIWLWKWVGMKINAILKLVKTNLAIFL